VTEQFPPSGDPGAPPAAAPAPKARRGKTALMAGGSAAILAIAGLAAFLGWPDSGGPAGPHGPAALAATFDLPGHGILYSASFSADGKLLALEETGKIVIWDTVTRTYRATLTLPGAPEEIGFSASDTQVTAIDQDGAVLGWNLTTGTHSVITPAGDKRSSPALSGDGSVLAAQDSAGDGTDVWDLRTQRLIADLADPDARPIYSVALDNAGRTLAVTGVSRIYVWDIPSRKVIATLPFPPGARTPSSLLSADGTDVTVDPGDGTKTATLWDVATQSSATPLDARWPREFANLYLAVAGAVGATQSRYQSLDLWNLSTRGHILTVGSPSRPVGYLFAVGPGGHEVLTTPHIRAQNQVATLWNIP
jgi:hypothetical protein